MREIETWHLEYELRQVIDRAVRWGIDGVHKDTKKDKPYSIFTYFVENSRENFEKFRTQLNKKLCSIENWRAVEIDLNQKFILMIDQYIEWHQEHFKELRKFDPYNPYDIILDITESTRLEIEKYFPEIGQYPTKIISPKKASDFSICVPYFEKEDHGDYDSMNTWYKFISKQTDIPWNSIKTYFNRFKKK